MDVTPLDAWLGTRSEEHNEASQTSNLGIPELFFGHGVPIHKAGEPPCVESWFDFRIIRTACLAAGAEVAGGDERAGAGLAHDGRVVLVDADDPRRVRDLPVRSR